jgi:glutathione peroxidase
MPPCQNLLKQKARFYDFKVKSIEGEIIDFQSTKAKKVVVINVASKCGYTPQYADWEKFHQEHGEDVIVPDSPNNFMGQEQAATKKLFFCQKNYGVSFQLFDKVAIKMQHPLFKWLSSKELNG